MSCRVMGELIAKFMAVLLFIYQKAHLNKTLCNYSEVINSNLL